MERLTFDQVVNNEERLVVHAYKYSKRLEKDGCVCGSAHKATARAWHDLEEFADKYYSPHAQEWINKVLGE